MNMNRYAVLMFAVVVGAVGPPPPGPAKFAGHVNVRDPVASCVKIRYSRLTLRNPEFAGTFDNANMTLPVAVRRMTRTAAMFTVTVPVAAVFSYRYSLSIERNRFVPIATVDPAALRVAALTKLLLVNAG